MLCALQDLLYAPPYKGGKKAIALPRRRFALPVHRRRETRSHEWGPYLIVDVDVAAAAVLPSCPICPPSGS